MAPKLFSVGVLFSLSYLVELDLCKIRLHFTKSDNIQVR